MRLDDLVADRHHRVERGLRVLEDHRHAAPAALAHLALGRASRSSPSKLDRAGDDLARAGGACA